VGGDKHQAGTPLAKINRRKEDIKTGNLGHAFSKKRGKLRENLVEQKIQGWKRGFIKLEIFKAMEKGEKLIGRSKTSVWEGSEWPWL